MGILSNGMRGLHKVVLLLLDKFIVRLHVTLEFLGMCFTYYPQARDVVITCTKQELSSRRTSTLFDFLAFENHALLR